MIIKQSKERPEIKWAYPSASAFGMKATSSQPVKVETSGVALSSNKVKKGLGSIDLAKGVWVLPNGETVKLPKGLVVLDALKSWVKGKKSFETPSRGPFSQWKEGPKNLLKVLKRTVDKAKVLGLIIPEGRKPGVRGRKLVFCFE
jgi:hypothetical protein